MIALERITKYFNRGSVNEVLALDHVDLEIAKGDFITVIGSNGAGKSTLLNCVAGTFPLDEGRFFLDKKDVTALPEYKRARFVGRVFQDPLLGTCAPLSLEQNLALAGKRGMRRGLGLGVKNRDRTFFRKQLSKLGLGLENRLEDKAGLLSGGQRQALTLLMATLVRPKLLLLDEHTAALDPKTARQIRDLTRKIVEEQGLTTLMVTHNMNQAIELGNRLIMMHQGKIIMDVQGDEKRTLTKKDLLDRFYRLRGEELSSDRMLLA